MVGVPLAHVAGAAVGFLVGLGPNRPSTCGCLRDCKTAPAPERFEAPVLDRIVAAPGEWARTGAMMLNAIMKREPLPRRHHRLRVGVVEPVHVVDVDRPVGVVDRGGGAGARK